MNHTLLKLLQFESSVYVALIALIVFIILYRKISHDEKPVALAVFVYGLTEVSAGVLIYYHHYNIWLYNIMMIPQALSISYAMLPKMKRNLTHKVLFYGVIILSLLHIANIIFLQGINQFANFTFIPFCTWLAVISYFYLRQKLETIEVKPFDSLTTWLAIATMIDNAASMPILTAIGWSQFISTPDILTLVSIITLLYSFWYLLIIFGLVWTRTSFKSVFSSR